MTPARFNCYGDRGEADVVCVAGRCDEKFGTWSAHDPLVGGPAFAVALTYVRGRGEHFVARTCATIARPLDTAAVSLALSAVPPTTLRPIVRRPSELPVFFTCSQCKRRSFVATPRTDRRRVVDRLSGRAEEGRAV